MNLGRRFCIADKVKAYDYDSVEIWITVPCETSAPSWERVPHGCHGIVLEIKTAEASYRVMFDNGITGWVTDYKLTSAWE